MNPTEEIKAKLDIVDIVSSYIALNQLGSNFKARCPFHNEKTASFIVSKEKQIWHCFGCGKGGDLISFVQEYENLTFAEALRLLAQRANVSLPTFRPEQQESHAVLYTIMAAAVEFYRQKLAANDLIASKVKEYLAGRGVDSKVISHWQLGLSSESWDELYAYLKKQNFSDEDIFQAGLSLKKKQGSGYLDRFRQRLMFPLFDSQGRPVAFTSRTLSGIAYDTPDEGGKYVNSPQTPIYDKSKMLYGWHLAKADIHQKKYLIIVEGNMDVIAAQTAGTVNTVAVSGTALTIDQIKMIKRYTNNVILAFDGDAAGSKAAFRGISLGWQEELNLKILLLPKGQDPADVIKQDKKIWLTAIKESIPVMDFYFQKVLAAIDLTRADHKKIAVQKLLPIIKYLQSNVEQIHYLQLLSDKLNIPLPVLQNDFAQTKAFIETQPKPELVNKEVVNKDYLLNLSEQALALAFYKDGYLQKLVADIEPEMLAGDLQSLYKKVIIYYTKHQFLKDFGDYLELTPEEKQRWITLSLTAEKDYLELPDKDLDKYWQNVFNGLKRQHLKQQHLQLIRELQQAETERNAELQDKISHQINILNKEIHKLQ